MIGQIVSEKIEILATSKNYHLLISLLTSLSNELKEHLLMRELVPSSDRIYDLECKYCGAILSRFPNKGEEISCSKCNYEQIVW